MTDKFLKGKILILAGIPWLIAAALLASFLARYIMSGAGASPIQILLQSGSTALGVVHVIGLFWLMAFTAIVGIGLICYGAAGGAPNSPK